MHVPRGLGLALVLSVSACAHLSAPSIPDHGVKEAVPAPQIPRFVSAAEDPQNGPCIQTTHGCIALNAAVSDATIGGTICLSGYTKSVRPPTSYTKRVKAARLSEAGIAQTRAREFELDHIVPLALGGHPRNPSNLALQPWDGEHGAKMKDILERRLQELVCSGQVTLIDARLCIAQDWEACANRVRSRY